VLLMCALGSNAMAQAAPPARPVEEQLHLAF
jgi:hypothetical protein